MKISMLCFSRTGWETGKRLADGLRVQDPAREILLEAKSRYVADSITESHRDWTGRQFQTADAVIFIGACGIAVRSIAPFIVSKKTDPAVLVIDECGKYVISLLSGHLGGANELAAEAAGILGALPVITTATDLHSQFAVDVFAAKNRCGIRPMSAAKEVSAAILAGEPVGFYSEYPWEGALPEGLAVCDEAKNDSASVPRVGIAVSIRKNCTPFPVTVHVIPGILTLGMGCRKGKEAGQIRKMAERCLEEEHIYREALEGISSIDLKKEEAGILALAEEWNLPFRTFSSEQLRAVPGDFTKSSFVSSVTGVDNVCERSAVLASGQGELIRKKTGAEGVTAALAQREWRIRFE